MAPPLDQDTTNALDRPSGAGSDLGTGLQARQEGRFLPAVVPVLGWWDQRRGLKSQEMSFSLVVSVFGPGVTPRSSLGLRRGWRFPWRCEHAGPDLSRRTSPQTNAIGD